MTEELERDQRRTLRAGQQRAQQARQLDAEVRHAQVQRGRAAQSRARQRQDQPAHALRRARGASRSASSMVCHGNPGMLSQLDSSCAALPCHTHNMAAGEGNIRLQMTSLLLCRLVCVGQSTELQE